MIKAGKPRTCRGLAPKKYERKTIFFKDEGKGIKDKVGIGCM
jgi:hypothetical protein